MIEARIGELARKLPDIPHIRHDRLPKGADHPKPKHERLGMTHREMIKAGQEAGQIAKPGQPKRIIIGRDNSPAKLSDGPLTRGRAGSQIGSNINIIG